MKDAQGHPLATSSQEAARLYNLAQQSLLEYRLSTMQTIKETIAADPHFVMAHCLHGDQFMMNGFDRTRRLLAERARLRPRKRAAVERDRDIARQLQEAA